MKNLVGIFLIIGSLLIGTNLVMAEGANHTIGKNKTKLVSCTEQVTQMTDLIGTPMIELDADSKVEVSFAINEYNVVEVLDVKTENKELEKLVYQKLNGKRIRGNEVKVSPQSLRLVFKTEARQEYLVF